MTDPIQQFMAAIEATGLIPPDSIHADGKLRRFNASGKRGDDTGWYVLHLRRRTGWGVWLLALRHH